MRDYDLMADTAETAPLHSVATTSTADPGDLTEIARLAQLSPMAYDREREAAAKTLGIRVATLDDAVKHARVTPESASGSELPFEDIEPWSSPVDAAQSLDLAYELLSRFVVADPATLHAAAVWTAMTWFVEHATVLPLALITAPEKGCGKTVLLSSMGKLSRWALPTSNISPSALFRAVDAWHPTLLIDEADTFVKENMDLRGIINSGHTRDTAHVIRSTEIDGKWQPRTYSTWSAKAIAGIGHLADTIESRSIILKMRRALPGEKSENLRHAEQSSFKKVQRQFARWAADSGKRFAVLQPIMPELSNRDADNWEPLLALADMAGNDWPRRIRHAAHMLTSRGDAPTTNEELLADIRTIFTARGRNRLASTDLLESLASDSEAPWATWNRGRSITARQLAKRLGDFGIAPKSIRIGNTVVKGYDLSQFADAFTRYLPDTDAESVTQLQASEYAGFDHSPSVTEHENVADT